MAFFSDFANLAAQMLLFFYIGKLVPSNTLPTYGGVQATLRRVRDARDRRQRLRPGRADSYQPSALRQEQMMGTLESLLVTPTAAATVQIGSAVFDLVYMPLRTAVFLGFMVLFAGVRARGFRDPSRRWSSCSRSSRSSGGSASPALRAILTFKRGAGAMSLGALLLGLTSGAFFPLDAAARAGSQTIAEYNPLAIAIEALRRGAAWVEPAGTAWRDAAILVPLSVLRSSPARSCSSWR